MKLLVGACLERDLRSFSTQGLANVMYGECQAGWKRGCVVLVKERCVVWCGWA
jgi:hypothetical protein